MSEQLFRLNGENWDLDELAYSFQQGPASVKKIEEFYYLILDIDPAKTDEEKLDAANTALTQMCAICLVRDEGFRSPTISEITRRDPVTCIVDSSLNRITSFPASAVAR